ncbi:MAG: ABC transporter ATP-binding protein [Acidimicrobiia bacterium]
MNSPGALLEVTDWNVSFPTSTGLIRAVDDVAFHVREGETLGIVGESGCGKSTVAMSLFGLVDSPPAVVSGHAAFDGLSLSALTGAELQQIRGSRVGFIFQDPTSALNPVVRVGEQIQEALWAHHRDTNEDSLRHQALELLEVVGLTPAERLYSQFPFELSGGMRQRIVVAMAIANKPDLLIADEPTTALDVTIQAQIVDLLEVAKGATGAAAIFISHDLGLVGHVSDRLAVMYAGRIVETGATGSVFSHPQHPYTAGLLACHPRLDEQVERLESISGSPPHLGSSSIGCDFEPRCAFGNGQTICKETTPLLESRGSGKVACHFTDRVESAIRDGRLAAGAAGPDLSREPRDRSSSDNAVLVQLRGVSASYPVIDPESGHRGVLEAVDHVDLTIRKGETLGLVGESGCGKSTLARTILQLHRPSDGEILFDGVDVTGFDRRRLQPYRRRMQMVFQNPFSSLNPKLTVGSIVGEPMQVNGYARSVRRERVPELLQLVGLNPSDSRKYPYEFSGGQRQRIAIARALALEPALLILDEAVSALDVSIQAQILNLLKDLQSSLGLSYLFVSHDLGAVGQISDRVAVMYAGRIVERGLRDVILNRPRHPYTAALLESVPMVGEGDHELQGLEGRPPNPLDPPSGCRFRTRCWKATELCATETPPLEAIEPRHLLACHFPLTPDEQMGGAA